MRNLRSTRVDFWDASGAAEPSPPVTAVCWDPETDDTICATGPSEHSPVITLGRLTQTISGCDHTVLCSWEPSPGDTIVSIHHTGECICIILAGGDIVTITESHDHSASPVIEIVGSNDEAITAASWSPDGELLALATKTAMALMSRSFEPIAEVPLAAADLAASKHVSVGWGKKETQFHGRGAKALRDPTVPDKIDLGEPSPLDDGETMTLSWRGDGAYVALSAVERIGGEGSAVRRVVRVYARQGTLDGVSEPVDGLEGALSWRPEGNLMAGVQRLKDRVDVVFFERNGLRHGQFTLRVGGTAEEEKRVLGRGVIRLFWNADSTVLAAVLSDRVQLWTMGNYHWYLKQEIALPSFVPHVLSWHPEKPLKLAVASASTVMMAEYVFGIAGESSHSAKIGSETGNVVAVDGKTAKLTPFCKANVPPPMALFEIELGAAIADICCCGGRVGILHRNGVDVYNLEPQPKLLGQISLAGVLAAGDEEELDTMPRQICFSSLSTLHVLVSRPRYGAQVYAVTLAKDGSATSELLTLEVDGHAVLSDFKMATTSNQDHQHGGYIQKHVGSITRLGGAGVAKATSIRLPVFLPWFDVVVDHNGLEQVFGLSSSGHLYADSKILVKNCTSFLTTPSHLVYTTSNHFVKFVHLNGPGK